MTKLCKKCHNLMEVNTAHGDLQFICQSCETYQKAEPEDSLRYTEDNQSSSHLSAMLLRKAKYDKANPIVQTKCPKCKYHLARQIRADKKMILINTCMKCTYNWI